MDKEKKTFPKIILHVCEYILLAFIIFLIIFVVLKACEKDVNAYTNEVRTTLSTSDIEDRITGQTTPKNIYASSFYIYNLNDVYTNRTIIFNVHPYDNSGNLPNTFNVYIQSYGDDSGFGLHINDSSSGSNVYTYLGWQTNRQDDIYVCTISSLNGLYYYGLYLYNENEIGENISIKLYESTAGFYYPNTNFDIIISAPLWTRDVLTKNNSYTLLEAIAYLVRTDVPVNVDPFEYRQEYLFGDLVSSFLNIQFGQVRIGNTTFDFTFGLLFLFVLGLGALFVIIKVFLGG